MWLMNIPLPSEVSWYSARQAVSTPISKPAFSRLIRRCGYYLSNSIRLERRIGVEQGPRTKRVLARP